VTTETAPEVNLDPPTVGFRPIGDRILVRPAPEPENEQRSTSGLFIPKTAQEKPNEGTILARGDGKYFEDGRLAPWSVNVGDKIMYGKFSGSEIKVNGEKLLIMHQDDVLGVIE